MHVGGVRQTAQIVALKNKNVMRVGDTEEVLFKVQYGVEIMNKGDRIMLREGATRAVGFVTGTASMALPAQEIIAKFLQ